MEKVPYKVLFVNRHQLEKDDMLKSIGLDPDDYVVRDVPFGTIVDSNSVPVFRQYLWDKNVVGIDKLIEDNLHSKHLIPAEYDVFDIVVFRNSYGMGIVKDPRLSVDELYKFVYDSKNFIIVHNTDVHPDEWIPKEALAVRRVPFAEGSTAAFAVTAVRMEAESPETNRNVRIKVVGNCVETPAADAVIDSITERGFNSIMNNGSLGLSLMTLGAVIEHGTVGRTIDDLTYSSVSGFLLSGVLEQCGCGLPDEVLEFVYDGLSYLDPQIAEKSFDERWAVRKVAEAKYGNGSLYFMWHRLEELDLLEHGSSAPGWLTGTGEHFFQLLKYVKSGI